jgi:hypothetical protein
VVDLPASLTRSRIVFLTGAGASAPLGLPTTAGFLQRFVDSAMSTRLSGMPEGVWRLARERLSQRQPTDIEVVLQELEAVGLWSDRFASDFSFFQSAMDGFRPTLTEKGMPEIEANGLADLLARDAQTTFGEFAEWSRRLAEAIYDEVVACYGTVDSGAAADLYRGLLGVMDQFDVTDPIRTVPFFTLNYDIAVEHAVEALNLGLVDGFDRGLAGRKWSPVAYTGYVEHPDSMTVVLVKLHGSVRLGQTEEGGLIELPQGTHRDPAPHRHALLYPSLGPKLLDAEPYRTNYSILRSCLMHAELCVVIGTTLRDTELNVLIGGCLEENEKLYLIVLGPEASSADVADRIGCDPTRIGGAVGRFEIEDPEVLRQGQGRTLNAIRRWWMSRSETGPHRFGTDVEF